MVIWEGVGVVVELINGQWVLLGEKALRPIKLIKSKKKHDTILVAEDQVLVDRFTHNSFMKRPLIK